MVDVEGKSREFEPTAEQRDEVSFEGYRELVETLNATFRETGGVLGAQGYQDAMTDPHTVKMRVGGGAVLPFLVPMEHTMGYDIPRTRSLTGQPETYILAVPVDTLTAEGVEIMEPNKDGQFDAESAAILVETDHEETQAAKDMLPEALARFGRFKAQDFLDVRIQKPERQPATMTIYDTRFVAVDQAGQELPRRDVDFYAAYEELVESGDPLTQHTKLIDVKTLRQDVDAVEELWDLCKDRFSWLGDYHPISMEDTKDFFLNVLFNDDTHTLVRYDDEGKAACLGFFLSGLDECTWLSKSYRDKLQSESNDKGEEMLFFYGIASRIESVHYAQDVMQLLAHIGQRTGGKWRMMFESTNMSSIYIPRLVNQYVGEGEGVQMVEPVKHLKRIDYWYLAPEKDEPTETTTVR